MSRASLVLLIAAGLLASANAEAASLNIPTMRITPPVSINNTIRSNVTIAPVKPIGPVMTMDHHPPCYSGCAGAPPPAYQRYPRRTVFDSNDQFDTTGNLNPGGGNGGGIKPGKKPNAQ